MTNSQQATSPTPNSPKFFTWLGQVKNFYSTLWSVEILKRITWLTAEGKIQYVPTNGTFILKDGRGLRGCHFFSLLPDRPWQPPYEGLVRMPDDSQGPERMFVKGVQVAHFYSDKIDVVNNMPEEGWLSAWDFFPRGHADASQIADMNATDVVFVRAENFMETCDPTERKLRFLSGDGEQVKAYFTFPVVKGALHAMLSANPNLDLRIVDVSVYKYAYSLDISATNSYVMGSSDIAPALQYEIIPACFVQEMAYVPSSTWGDGYEEMRCILNNVQEALFFNQKVISVVGISV